MKKLFILLAITILPFSVSSKENNKGFSYPQICKAAIATSVYRKAKGIKTISSRKNNVTISYVRSDGKRYTYNCKIQKKEIRWKDQTMRNWNKNVKLFYQVSANENTLKINSVVFGETMSKSFTKSDF